MEDSAAKERTSVLVLCTGNSARSILCEALLRERGAGRLAAYSAGSQPKAEPHNEALRLLASRGHAINGFRSKSWDEFALPGAPELDVVITVCDSAASESCPVWPGAPVTAHWGIPDPAGAPQDRLEAEFAIAYKRLSRRVDAFVGLPFEEMGAEELKRKLNEIGQFDL
ncbi:MAG: arsenate reductase ArsC [Pseudomonadota bacterium]